MNTHLEHILWLLHTHRGQPASELRGALERDPLDPAAHRLRAGMIVAWDRLAARPELAASLALLESQRRLPRDPYRLHAAAARAWLEGDAEAALDRYAAIVVDDPLDILAIVVAHALDFRLGRRRMLRDRMAQLLPSWHESMPGCASVLAMYAFGLIENGDERQAERMAHRALAADPSHPGAVHAMAHVLDTQGRGRDGIAFFAEQEAALSAPTGFAVHLQWHRALLHLELDQADAALRIYDERIADAEHGAWALADASALLWRLGLRGMELGGRWRVLADRWERQALGAAGPFLAMHAMMAFAADARSDAAAAVFEALRSGPARSWHPEPRVAEPFCRALLAFSEGRYTLCIERLAAVRDIAHRCGGSLPQCDIVHLTHTEAALRARQASLARALVAERAARKPSSHVNRALSRRVGGLSLAAA